MLIIPEKPENFYEPVKVVITYRGKDLTLMLRPYDNDAEAEWQKKATKVEALKDPDTGVLKRVEYVDKVVEFGEMADHVIASFSGIGNSKDRPWPVDKEHKVKLLSITRGPKDKKHIVTLVADAAKALAADQIKKLLDQMEAEGKN